MCRREKASEKETEKLRTDKHEVPLFYPPQAHQGSTDETLLLDKIQNRDLLILAIERRAS